METRRGVGRRKAKGLEERGEGKTELRNLGKGRGEMGDERETNTGDEGTGDAKETELA